MAITLIVETGVGVPGSNTLVSSEYADTYFSNHPFYHDSWGEIDAEQRKRLLMMASKVVTSLFPWPSSGFPTPDGLLYTPYVPNALLDAICEQAYWMNTSQGNPDSESESAGIEELKVDVIQLKFGGSEARRAVPVAVVRLLRGLGVALNNGKVRRVQVSLG